MIARAATASPPSLARRLRALDSETLRFIPGCAAPPIVVGSWAGEEGGGGAEAGAGIGAFGGPLDPITVPLGAAIGGAITGGIASWGAGKILKKEPRNPNWIVIRHAGGSGRGGRDRINGVKLVDPDNPDAGIFID